MSRLTVTREQAGVLQRAGVGGEVDAVGGHRQVAEPGLRGQAADERRQIAAEQRLATGQADAVDAERHEDVDDPRQLFECQQILARQPGVSGSGMQY